MALPPKRKRPPLAEAMEWASLITAVSLMMALPAAAGAWADARLGTTPWLVLAGALLGIGAGMTHLFARLSEPRGTRRNAGRHVSKTDRPPGSDLDGGR